MQFTRARSERRAGENMSEETPTTPNPETTPQTQTQTEPNPNPNPWVGAVRKEERQKGREEAQKEFAQQNAEALRLAKLLKDSGYDPGAVAAQYEQQMRAAKAQEVGLAPQAYGEVEALKTGVSQLAEQQKQIANMLHNQKVEQLMAQAESLVQQTEQLAKDYAEHIRGAIAVTASRYLDNPGNLPSVDELVGEGRKAFRDAAWPKILQQQTAAATQAALTNQQYRDSHQALSTPAPADTPLPATDFRRIATSSKPEDKAQYDEYIRAVKSGDRAQIEAVMAKLGLRAGA